MKKILVVTIGVLLIAAACNKQAAVQPASNSQPVVDQTANWKTYTNTQYGFEFKYPATALVTPDSNTTTITVKDKNYEFHVLIENKKLETTHLDVPSGTTVTMPEKKIGTVTWYQGILDGPMANVEYNYALGNNKLSVLIWQNTAGWENLKAGESNTAFVNNLFTNQSSQDQILSTFKFTDATSTVNWKTYTNTDYSYSIKYPSTWTVDLKTKNSSGKTLATFLAPGMNNAPHDKIVDIQVSPTANVSRVDSADYIKSNGNVIISTSPVVVGGVSTDKFITNLNNGYNMEVYVEKNSETYVLRLQNTTSGDKEYIDNFNLMLSSFKFTK